MSQGLHNGICEGVQARCTKSYRQKSEGFGQIALLENDIVNVVSMFGHQKGLCLVRYGGENGEESLFPIKFLEPVIEEENQPMLTVPRPGVAIPLGFYDVLSDVQLVAVNSSTCSGDSNITTLPPPPPPMALDASLYPPQPLAGLLSQLQGAKLRPAPSKYRSVEPEDEGYEEDAVTGTIVKKPLYHSELERKVTEREPNMKIEEDIKNLQKSALKPVLQENTLRKFLERQEAKAEGEMEAVDIDLILKQNKQQNAQIAEENNLFPKLNPVQTRISPVKTEDSGATKHNFGARLRRTNSIFGGTCRESVDDKENKPTDAGGKTVASIDDERTRCDTPQPTPGNKPVPNVKPRSLSNTFSQQHNVSPVIHVELENLTEICRTLITFENVESSSQENSCGVPIAPPLPEIKECYPAPASHNSTENVAHTVNRVDLLKQIRNGINLKPVSPVEKSRASMTGLMHAVASRIRENIADSDSDSGDEDKEEEQEWDPEE